MNKYVAHIILLTMSVHCAELPSLRNDTVTTQVKQKREWTDEELKRFGEACYKLPTALWTYMLNFLLGSHHDVYFSVDPQCFGDITRANSVKMNNGWLVVPYKEHVYAWNPYGYHIAPNTSWYSCAIPQGWSFNRFERGAGVLINENRDAVKMFDDVSLKEQAHYTFPAKSYFLTANRGRTLLHGPHPLMTKAAIDRVHIIRQRDEQDEKSEHENFEIRMPGKGVMPPMTLGEKFFGAHAFERDTVYIFNLAALCQSTFPLPKEITLSDRVITNNRTVWNLLHPTTYLGMRLYLDSVIVNDPEPVERSVIAILPDTEVFKGAPSLHVYFGQKNSLGHFMFLDEIGFIGNKKPLLVSLLSSPFEKPYYALNYWDIETGEVRHSISDDDDACSATYDISRSGKLVLSDNNLCDVVMPSLSNSALSPRQRTFFCDKFTLSRSTISPSGCWVFRHAYQRNTSNKSYDLSFTSIHYLGGDKVRRMSEVTVGWRKVMMRFYALQRASEMGVHVRPPEDMQKALGMKMV
jgi:hypothetical protein